MRLLRLWGAGVGLAVSLAAPAHAIVVNPQIFYRWSSTPGYACSTPAGTINLVFASQPVEWNNMAAAQFKIVYVTNGVPTVNGPFPAPSAAGSQVFGSLAMFPPSYPATVTVRLETYLGGTLKYVSSMSATCAGDGAAGTATIVNGARGTAVDFTGDGRTDFSIVRNTGGNVTWWTGDAASLAFTAQVFGISTDFFVSGDFDGDGKSDVAIWRPGAAGVAGFWILRSSDLAVTFTQFGQTSDDPTVVGDYDGDGKTDIAVYRAGATPGAQSRWYYKRSSDGVIVNVPWGLNGDFPAPGDYDGDGKADFAIQRDGGGGQGVFWIKQSGGSVVNIPWGLATDFIVPGDYDGDGKTDVAVSRTTGGNRVYWIRRSSNGGTTIMNWGVTGDVRCPGDYDGDGTTDVAIWRPSATPGQSAFWVNRSTGGVLIRQWGHTGDHPVAAFVVH